MTIADLSKEEIIAIIDKAADLKAHPEKYSTAMKDKTLLMLFQKPSLRTRVSFEVGMTQMGGHGIFYSIADSPLGVKETYGDTGHVISRMVNIVMARVNKKEDVRQLAAACSIPVINALDDWAHPCQMLCDLLTIVEKKGRNILYDGKLKMAYCGDLKNNVTYDLMRLASVIGYECRVAGPFGEGYDPAPEVVAECAELCKKSGGKVVICKTAEEAVAGVDIIYCDSWMSYGIPKAEEAARKAKFMPFQVNERIRSMAKPDMIFMNCLPAARGMEQTAEVVDGPHSVVFDEAENRLHSCKALMLFLLGLGGFGKAKCCECCSESCHCCDKCSCQKKGKRYLVALGGNALLQPGEKGQYAEAQRNAEVTCEQLTQLILKGNELVVTHGNGPQVGAIKLQNQLAAEKVPDMPLHVCGSESQGYLGYLLQQTFQNVFAAHGIKKDVASVVTQTRVDAADPAFKNPTKPIGRFYSKEEAEKLKAQGKTMVEDSGRGYRVVVPSPMPLEVVEGKSIKALVSAGSVVISTGGGGIPVIRDDHGKLVGVEAVIDKDLGAAVLGEMMEADALIILTDIDAAYLNYSSPSDRKRIAHMTVAEAEEHYAKGEFAKGSMGPKVRAGMKFARATGKPCIITALNKVQEALDGKCGTLITPN